MSNKVQRMYCCPCGFTCRDSTDLERHRLKKKPCGNTVDGRFLLKPEILYDLTSSDDVPITVNVNVPVHLMGSSEELKFYYNLLVADGTQIITPPCCTTIFGHYLQSTYCNLETPQFWSVRKPSKRFHTVLIKTQKGNAQELSELDFIRHVMYNIGAVLQALYGRRAASCGWRESINAYEVFLTEHKLPTITDTTDRPFKLFPAFKPDVDQALLRCIKRTYRNAMNNDSTRYIKAQISFL